MERFFGKYIGRSKAIVIDNRDPEYRGRIRVDSPILGETTWIDYLNPPNWYNPPRIGDVVYLECASLDEETPVAHGIARKPEGIVTVSKFGRQIPSNRGFESPGGHLIEIDDGRNLPASPDPKSPEAVSTEYKGIRITTSAGNKIHISEDDGFREGSSTPDESLKQQYILIEDVNGNMIKLDYNENILSIISKGITEFTTVGSSDYLTGGNEVRTVNGNRLSKVDGDEIETVDGDKTDTVGGDKTEDVTGNKTDTVGGDLTINVTGKVTINCEVADINTTANTNITAGGNAVIEAAEIQLNGADSGITTENSHQGVIDLITGVPVQASTNVKSNV